MTDVTKETNQKQRAYSVAQVSDLTSLSKPYIRNEIRDGALKAKKFGRRVLILAEDLEAYLKDGAES